MNTVVTLAVSGPAPCTYENVQALLNDRLGLGDKDGEGNFTLLKDTDPGLQINIIAPVTNTRLAPGVAAVLDWCVPAMAMAIALTDGEAVQSSVAGADRSSTQTLFVDDIDSAILEILDQHQQVGDVALLVCFDPENPDAETVDLMAGAKERRIPIFNLSLGLFPMDADDYSGAFAGTKAEQMDPAPEPQQLDAFDAVAEAEKESAAPEQLDADKPDDVVATPKTTALAQAAAFARVEGVEPYQYGSGLDEFEAVLNTQMAGVIPGDPDVPTDVIVSSLHRVMAVGQGLLDLLRSRLGNAPAAKQLPSYDPATELPPIPVVMTTQVQPAVKMRREFRKSETDEWRPAGRGRPRKDYEYREVPFGD